MSMDITTKNDLRTVLGPGHEVCPSCDGDGWKSARMIVLEGTTSIQGIASQIDSNSGSSSGGFRDFLFSNTWFELDKNVDIRAGFTSTSGLVEEIRRLMVAYGSMIPMPPLPSISLPSPPSQEKIASPQKPREPSEPARRKDPKKPHDLSPPKLKRRPWYLHFLKGMIWAVICSYLLAALAAGYLGLAYPEGFTLGWNGNSIVFGAADEWTGQELLIETEKEYHLLAGIVFVIASMPVVGLWAFGGNKRLRRKYEEKLELYQKHQERRLQKYQDKLDRNAQERQKDLSRYEAEYQEYLAQMKVYTQDCNRVEKLEQEQRKLRNAHKKEIDRCKAAHQKVMAQYETEKIRVDRFRELLWLRARVCMRCGTAYLGPG